VEPSKPDVGDPNTHDLGVIGILRDRKFWLLFMGLATSSFSMNLIMVHHIAYLTDSGFGSTSIASVLGIIGLAGLIGRIGFGWLSDRIGTTPVFAIVTGCMLTAILSLTWSGKNGSVPLLYVFGALFGASVNVAIILFARPTIDCFGSRNFGRVSGLAYVGAGIGVASGPAFAGVAFDATGNYLSSFGVAAVALVLSVISLLMLGRAVKRRAAG
jgi:cyanate permease